jgi:hypothetical protein
MPVEKIEHFSMEPIVEKTRHCVDHGGPVWSVDVFRGLNAGLVLAEVELDRPDQPIDRSDWVGRPACGADLRRLPLHLSVLQSRPDSDSSWKKNSVAGQRRLTRTGDRSRLRP